MSIFTRYLNELTNYSKRIDKAKTKYIDLVRIKNLGEKITTAYSNNYISFIEYRMLIDLFAHLLVELRESVRMSGAVKRIEREVRA